MAASRVRQQPSQRSRPAHAAACGRCYGFARPFSYVRILSMKGGYFILALLFCLANGPAAAGSSRPLNMPSPSPATSSSTGSRCGRWPSTATTPERIFTPVLFPSPGSVAEAVRRAKENPMCQNEPKHSSCP